MTSSQPEDTGRRSRREDVRAWLRSRGYADVARQIEELLARWQRAGKKTRRNWWEVLAGGAGGRARTVDGVTFPVLRAARNRQARRLRRASGARAQRGNPAVPVRSSSAAVPVPGRVAAAPAARRPLGPARWREVPYPFVKWAGGKRQILAKILPLLPRSGGTYYEPFVGGGAVFFGLRPPKAVLSDRNERLIRTYRGIKNDVRRVMKLLDTYDNDKQFYLKMRANPVDGRSDAEVAAWMIYLNKVGWNGLYRVNSKNVFNVPFGDNAGKRIYDPDNLEACARVLAGAELMCEDFEKVVEGARRGDVVYFDPPYVPLSATSSFTSYTSDGFDGRDQKRLRDVALELKRRGVFVLLSNSSAPAVYDLYGGADFELVSVSVARVVNSDATRRGPVTELLIK
jgi:DNA adenine methylase